MLIVGISGGTGSGKTTTVNKLLDELPKESIEVLFQDSYYKSTSHLNKEERSSLNFDHPNAIDFELLVKHIHDLKNNKPVHQPVYSFSKHNRTKATILVQPKKALLIEGILIFTNPLLRELLDIKIFIDTDSDVRLIRRLKRDLLERDRNLNEVLTRYQNTIKPMHDQFIEPCKKHADIIIPNNNNAPIATHILKTIISEKL